MCVLYSLAEYKSLPTEEYPHKLFNVIQNCINQQIDKNRSFH